MNRPLIFIITFCVSCTLILGQQGTTIIQTPFGPKEMPVQPGQQTAPQQQTPAQQAPPVATPVVPNAQAPNPGNVPAQPEPQAGANPAQDDNSPVNLRIAGQDIRQVIQIIGDALKLNYVIDPTIKGTVDIFTNETLRRSDLLPILESILKINNATMIRTGNFYQIVPAASAARQPIEIISQLSRLSPDDQFVTQIIRMKFVAASEMSRILTPFLGESGSITVHETGNIILLTDRRGNIRKLLQLVDEFDSVAFQGQGIRLLPVKSNQARAVAEDLKTIFSGYGLSDKSAIRFIVIDRLNSILTITPNPEVFPEVERWISTLDQPVVLAGIRTFVYRVKNAKAVDLQRVLSELYTQNFANPAMGIPTPKAAIANPPIANPSIANPPPPTQPQGNPPGQPPVPQGQAATQGTVVVNSTPIRIIADEVTNSLVIQATQQQYADIERTLQQLDILRRQVLIDAQVYEVVLDDSSSLGISALLQNRVDGRQTTASFTSPPNGGPASLAVNTFAYIGRMRELLLFLNAQENRSRVRTLSAPSVMITDNGTAQFQVGTEVPIPTSSSVTPVQSGGTNLFAQTIQFRNTGVILRVKPQINDSGTVTLELSQEVS